MNFKKYDEYKELLRSRLTPKRYAHSLAVADEAVRLAEKYGGNREKAYVAGLLHDICKDESKDSLLQTLDKFGIIPSKLELGAPKLWHAKAGAAYVKVELGIDDSEIIDAISYHTTARADMTLLDKILYLADFTSADRDYDGVEDMRKAVDISIEKAMDEALSFSIMDLVEARRAIHPDTVEAYNQLVLSNNLK